MAGPEKRQTGHAQASGRHWTILSRPPADFRLEESAGVGRGTNGNESLRRIVSEAAKAERSAPFTYTNHSHKGTDEISLCVPFHVDLPFDLSLCLSVNPRTQVVPHRQSTRLDDVPNAAECHLLRFHCS